MRVVLATHSETVVETYLLNLGYHDMRVVLATHSETVVETYLLNLGYHDMRVVLATHSETVVETYLLIPGYHDMRVVLATHSEAVVEIYLLNRGYQVLFIPKFHCKLNPTERVWGQARVYTHKFTNFSLIRLRKILNPVLDSILTDTL